MPHLKLEHSTNPPSENGSDALLRELHETLERLAGIRISNCESRVLPASRYLVGRGEEDFSFVHLDVRFLEGRSRDVRRAVGEELLRLLTAAYEEAGPNIQITSRCARSSGRAISSIPPVR
jgi:5-carboxymethyl-2-hydroxymuconate isomerase